MVAIRFGTRLGSGGELYETGSTYPLRQVVVWKAELGYTVGSDPLHFQVVPKALTCLVAPEDEQKQTA